MEKTHVTSRLEKNVLVEKDESIQHEQPHQMEALIEMAQSRCVWDKVASDRALDDDWTEKRNMCTNEVDMREDFFALMKVRHSLHHQRHGELVKLTVWKKKQE